MRTRCFAVGLASVVFVLTTGTAWAFCSAPPPKVCSAYFQANVVVRGKVLSRTYVPHPGSDSNWIRYKIAVQKTFKGHQRSFRSLYTSNDSGRLWLNVGKSYVLFAYRSDHRLEIGCNEQPLSKAAKTSAVSEQITRLLASKPSRSTIEGQVLTSNSSSPLPGVTVTAIGAHGDYRVVSDRTGHFSMPVPPGPYRVEVDPRVVKQTIYSMIYTHPQSIDLAPGQCEQLQYRGVSR